MKREKTLFLAIGRMVLPLLLIAALSGCSSIEPWVKPYERDKLADPIMALDSDPVSTSYMQHVYEAREGARGGEGLRGAGRRNGQWCGPYLLARPSTPAFRPVFGFARALRFVGFGFSLLT